MTDQTRPKFYYVVKVGGTWVVWGPMTDEQMLKRKKDEGIPARDLDNKPFTNREDAEKRRDELNS